jgi:predicted RNase H-like HicB family nuclease
MKRKFTVVIEKIGAEFEARCREMPDAVARGRDKKDALEKIRAIITKMLGGDSDAGSAPVVHPISPPPLGPIIEVYEKHAA